MPISSAARIRFPHPLLTPTTQTNLRIFSSIFHTNLRPNLSIHPSSRFHCSQTISPATPQDCSVKFESMDLEQYSQELEVAVKAVHMACLLCRRVQESLIFQRNVHVQSKDDDSPVTVAGMITPPFLLKWLLLYSVGFLGIGRKDGFLLLVANSVQVGLLFPTCFDWSVQATVSWVLSEAFGSENVSIVAEEDVEALSKTNSAGLLNAVTKTVNESLAEAPSFGIRSPATPLNTSEVLEAISRCNSTGGPTGRFWVLDPVDGTLGFVRGDQYAVALALIEDGEPVLGVLGCPNYPMKKEWLSYQNGYHRIVARLTSASWDKGCVIYARKGSGGAWMQPLLQKEKKYVWPNSARQINVSTIDNPALATFCEPVEKANSSHSFTAGLAYSVGVRNQPLRVYSMVKYAAIARGDAEIFMKFARAGYKEKIWDHAAGVVIIQEAGGVVTDAGGHPLCFSKGMFLEGLDRGIIASSGATLHEKIIRAVDASWNSSSL